jgi:hypothetical protein
MNDIFTYTLNDNKSKNNCRFNFYKNNSFFGMIQFHIEYNSIIIGWLCISPGINLTPPSINHRKGYGTKMLQMFQEYILKNHQDIKYITLIPEKFDGNNKNILCNFYEKNGFIQESVGKPTYIKHIRFF